MIDRLKQSVVAFSAFVDRVMMNVGLMALGVMLVSMLIQIVARYIFSSPPAWTEELARFAMIWAAMCGSTAAFRRRVDPALVKVNQERFPHLFAASKWVEAFAVCMFALPVLYHTPYFLERHAGRITETMELNSALVVFIIPFAFVVIVVHLIARLCGATVSQEEGVQL